MHDNRTMFNSEWIELFQKKIYGYKNYFQIRDINSDSKNNGSELSDGDDIPIEEILLRKHHNKNIDKKFTPYLLDFTL